MASGSARAPGGPARPGRGGAKEAVVDGSAVAMSNPDKVLWPEPGFTKADLARYYAAVADRLLPQLAGRPVTLLRAPAGVARQTFLQKDLHTKAPAFVTTYKVWAPSADREVAYPMVSDLDGLVWLAQQNVVELHPGLFRVDRPDRSDVLVFDLDPGGPDPPVHVAAHWVREVLLGLGLDPLVKTSGKKGLHLLVPIARRYDPGLQRALGLAIARMAADRHPDALTVQMRKAEREGRLLVDWSRTGIGATLVAAWSPRASAQGTVATPLTWDEVGPGLDPTAFTLATVPERSDPWSDLPPPARLEKARAAVEAAGYELVDASPRARTPDR